MLSYFKFFSRYFRYHGLKVQVLMFPNGMVGHVFVTSLVHNDQGVANISGIGEKLLNLLRHLRFDNGRYLGIYVDGIFTPGPCIIPRYLNPSDWQARVNLRGASLRVNIENLFALHRGTQRFFSSMYRLKLAKRGVFTRKLITVSFFVLNCYITLRHTRSLSFDLPPLTLEEYVPLN